MAVNTLFYYNNFDTNVGSLKIFDTTNATSLSTGSLVVAGGACINDDLIVGGTLNISQNLNVSGNIDTDSNFTITATTESTSTSTGAFLVSGGVGIGKSMFIGENLNVFGTLTTHSLVYEESEIITSTADSTSLTTGAVVIAGGSGIGKNLNIGGVTKIYDTTNATNSLTGSLQVVGGGSISKDLYVGGSIYGTLAGGFTTSTVDSTSTSTGALQILGGVGIAKNLNVGGSITSIGASSFPTSSITNFVVSTSTDTGSLVVNGGVGINNNLYIGGNTNVSGLTSILSLVTNSTVDSTSSTTGSIQVLGGVGVKKNVNIGGDLNVLGNINGSMSSLSLSSTSDATSTSTGCLVCAGGVGIAKSLYCSSLNSTSGTIPTFNSTTGTISTFNSTTGTISTLNSTTGTISTFTSTTGTISTLNSTTGSIFDLTVSDTKDSTSTSTGSLVCAGGVGIAKNLYVGGTISGNSITQPYDDNTTKIANDQFVYNAIHTQNTVLRSPTGFENTTSSTLSYDVTNRVLTVAPVSTITGFNVWVSGIRYTYTSSQMSTTHGTTAGTQYYYYFTSTGLTYDTNFPNLSTSAVCSFVYYIDSTRYIATEERHSCVMDSDTHLELHNQIGTYYVSGLALSNYSTQPSPPTNTGNQFTSATGVISDEQLNTTIVEMTSSSYCVLYLTGSAVWTYTAGLSYPFINSVGSYINYNKNTTGTWSMESIGDNNYVNYYVVYVPSISTTTQMLLIPSQTIYANTTTAYAESFANLSLPTLPFAEFCVRYMITFATRNSYTTIGQCRIERVLTLISPSRSYTISGANNHQSLSGLLLAGSGVTYGHINDQPQSIYGAKSFADTTESTSISTGALITSGGVGIGKNLYVGGLTKFVNTTESTSTSTGSIIVTGGVGIAGNLNVNGTISGTFTISNVATTTESTSTSTGAFTVAGGVGIGKSLYVGSLIYSPSTQTAWRSIATKSGSPTLTAQEVFGGLIYLSNNSQTVKLPTQSDMMTYLTSINCAYVGYSFTFHIYFNGGLNTFNENGWNRYGWSLNIEEGCICNAVVTNVGTPAISVFVLAF